MPVLSPERPIQHEAYSQLHEDVSTFLAETLDGEMHSSYDFIFDGSDLIAEDRRAMSPIFDRALMHAETAALLDPTLIPEIVRSKAERTEFESIIAMARGEGPNTLVSIWEIPEYVLQHGSDIGGYRYDLRRAMMRIAHRLPNGKVRIESQTLDSGYRVGYESLYDKLGQPQPNDQPLYSQPIAIDLDQEDAANLNRELRDHYDRALFLATGVKHVAGRTKVPVLNTLIFVRQQYDLVDSFVNKHSHLHMNDIPEGSLYDLAAAMQRRLEGNKFEASDAATEMGGAGEEARASGEIYSGCGVTLGGDKTAEEQLHQLGFGNNLLRTMSCGVCGGKALGVECGNAKCVETDCGSELIDGEVIDNRMKSQREIRRTKIRKIALSLWDVLFGRKL